RSSVVALWAASTRQARGRSACGLNRPPSRARESELRAQDSDGDARRQVRRCLDAEGEAAPRDLEERGETALGIQVCERVPLADAARVHLRRLRSAIDIGADQNKDIQQGDVLSRP